jgi:hypothetical protein
MPPPPRKHHKHKNKRKGGGKSRVAKKAPRPAPPRDPDDTGQEMAYFQELVDSNATVVVVLRTGERLRGQMRYYDRDMFSLGQFEGPKVFVRKTSVRYLYEE